MTKRALMVDVGAQLKGTVQFEADVLPYLEWERLVGRQGEARRRRAGSSIGCARSRTTRRSRSSGGRRGSPTAALEALTAETWVGRSERELAWRLRELLHAHGARRARRSSRSSRRARTARCRTRIRPTRSSRRARSSTVDWGARVDGYCSDCTRTFSTGGRCPTSFARGLRRLPRRAAAGVRGHQGGHDRRRGRRARARADHGRRLRRELRPRARPRRRPGGARGAAPLDRVDGHARGGPHRHDRARASTCRASAACGSRTWRSSARTASSC